MTEILDLVESAYAAAEKPARWSQFLDRLATRLPAPSLMLMLRSPSPGDRGVVYARGTGPAFVRDYTERLWARDPWREGTAQQPEGSITLGHSHVSDEELEGCEFYREWLAPQNIHYPFTAILARQNGSACSTLSGFRSKADGPFRLEDLGIVETLLPHLSRALGIARELSVAESVRDALLEGVEGGASGWILLGRSGAVLAEDEAARELIARGDVLREEAGALRAADPIFDPRLRDLIEKAESGGPGAELTLPNGERTLRVRLTPVRPTQRRHAEPRPAVLALLAEPERLADARVQRLRRDFGLTPAECRIASLLADGRRLAQIAESVGISINTVRGHLKQVFAKTGTHRQAELVRLVLGALPRGSA